jgi:hypothetical protein
MTTSRPFLTRFAMPIEERGTDEPDHEPTSNGDAPQSCEARGESRFTKVRNETTDDE